MRLNMLQGIAKAPPSQKTTNVLHKEMFTIIDEAPYHKVEDIVENNQVQINVILAKLLAQTIDIDTNEYSSFINTSLHRYSNNQVANKSTNINEAQKQEQTQDNKEQTHIQQQNLNRQFALISLRKISRLGMSSHNLFDTYRTSDDIKYSILSYLNENEIHSIMSNIDHEWNILCQNTFYHNQFDYTFKSYVNKLFYHNENGDHNEYPKCVGTRIYFQCPWNCLWTCGTIYTYNIDYEKHQKMIVSVTTNDHGHDCNPFDINNNNNNNIAPKSTHGHDHRCHNSIAKGACTYLCSCSKINNCDNNNNNNKCGIKRIRLRSLKHIVPMNTMNRVPRYSNNYNCNNKQVQLLSELLTSKHDENEYTYPRTKNDIFGRQLVDVQLPFSDEKPFCLWSIKSWNTYDYSCEMMSQHVLEQQYNDGSWFCGVVDFVALDNKFPKWKKQFSRMKRTYSKYSTGDTGNDNDGDDDSDANDNDENFRDDEIFQIPVLIDITEILDINGDHLPCDVNYYKQFENIFRYGENLYFTRIWYHSRKKMLTQFDHDYTKMYPIQPFGTQTSKLQQNAMLSMPMALNSPNYKCSHSSSGLSNNNINANVAFVHLERKLLQNTTVLDIKKGRKLATSRVLDLNYVKQIAAIPVDDIISDYVIGIDEIKNPDKDRNYSYLEEHFADKVVLFRDYDGELAKVFIIKHNKLDEVNNCKINNKKEFEMIAQDWSRSLSFDNILNVESDSDNDSESDNKSSISDISNKSKTDRSCLDLNYFYNVFPLQARPVINFDLGSLIRQHNNNGVNSQTHHWETGLRHKEYQSGIIKILSDSNDIDASMKTHSMLLVDVKPETLTLLATDDELWYRDMDLDNKIVGIGGYYNGSHSHNDNYKQLQSNCGRGVKNIPYENLMIEGCVNLTMKDDDKWTIGVWLCDKEDYQEYDDGFNEFLWDLAEQIVVLIDITDIFDKFQENVLKPRWIEYQKQKNNDHNHDHGGGGNDKNSETVSLEKTWNNRRYFVNCGCLNWDRKSNKIFYEYWVHLDDKLHVAPFATYTQFKNINLNMQCCGSRSSHTSTDICKFNL